MYAKTVCPKTPWLGLQVTLHRKYCLSVRGNRQDTLEVPSATQQPQGTTAHQLDGEFSRMEVPALEREGTEGPEPGPAAGNWESVSGQEQP